MTNVQSADRSIEVAVALPVFNTYTYSVPTVMDEYVTAGVRVLVPFGRRRVTGYVLGDAEPIQKEIKAVLDVLDDTPLFPMSMMPFFKWIADYYKHPLGDVIRNALPGGVNLLESARLSITQEGLDGLKNSLLSHLEKELLQLLESGPCRVLDIHKKFQKTVPGAVLRSFESRGWLQKTYEIRQARTKSKYERWVCLTDLNPDMTRLSKSRLKIVECLKSQKDMSITELKALVPTAPALVKAMQKDGCLSIYSKRVYRDPFGEAITPDSAPILNRDQEAVVSEVCEAFGKGFETFLLRGVTASGKTEVYMRLAEEALTSGLSVLVLVPEIALISQTERRFRARFGERIAVLHSGLSSGERFDQWSRILQNEAAIAIGARSAIFAPFNNIGLIIVDEEHDTSYKQESSLRYNARDLAVVRAKFSGCIALLGSATPSVQSYFNVTTGKFRELTLHHRVEQRSLPRIDVVDLRLSKDLSGIRRFITAELRAAIGESLARGEQVLLFLNRRGYASFPVCAACGETIRCKNCDISLTYHRKANAYRCHYCGFSRSALSTCGSCGSDKIKHLGLGTEKIEDAVKAFFPEARIERMDRDTTRRKGAILKLLKNLANTTTDILVGTQMVAKGHDFPGITLVGVICADLSLNFPDFRAGERTFQLLAQVAGRAGRGDRPGRVILQTYTPDHFSIKAATDQDFIAFYEQEIGFRNSLKYPPFSRMIQLKLSGKDKQKTAALADTLGNQCRALKNEDPTAYAGIEVLGPIEASISKIAGQYRWQILLKGLNAGALHDFVGRLVYDNSAVTGNRGVRLVIDVDPFYMM